MVGVSRVDPKRLTQRLLAVIAAAAVTQVGVASAAVRYSVTDPPTPQPGLVVGSVLRTNGSFPVAFKWPAVDTRNACYTGWEVWIPASGNGPVDSGDLSPGATSYVYPNNYFYNDRGWSFNLVYCSAGVYYEGYGIPLTSTALNQTAASYGPGWTTERASSAYGSDQTYSTRSGASTTVKKVFSNLGIVAGKGPRGGSATVYVDGVNKGTFSLYSSSYKSRQVVWKIGYAQNKAHAVRIVNTSTSANNRVTLDAFVTLTRS
jgi:hypothetical protein